MTLLYDFKDFFDFIIFINSSFNSSSWCLLEHSFSVHELHLPLAVILIVFLPFAVILIVFDKLHEPITVKQVTQLTNTFDLSSKVQVLNNSVTPLASIFEVIIIYISIFMTPCHKAIYAAIFIPGPRTKIWHKLYVNNSSQLILMPFSDIVKTTRLY